MDPADIAVWCNAFFHQVTESVLRFGGVPVKYMGDGFLAFFVGDEHKVRATDAAISSRGSTSDQLVVSLASGPLHLSSIGHASYARPDILGDVVNRTFRINAWAASHSTTRITVASEAIPPSPSKFTFGPKQSITLKGITQPVEVREVTGRGKEPKVLSKKRTTK